MTLQLDGEHRTRRRDEREQQPPVRLDRRPAAVDQQQRRARRVGVAMPFAVQRDAVHARRLAERRRTVESRRCGDRVDHRIPRLPQPDRSRP